MGIKGRGYPEGLGSYCEEWGIKWRREHINGLLGEGDPEGLGSYCEEWCVKGRGTLRGWVLIVKGGGVLRRGGP